MTTESCVSLCERMPCPYSTPCMHAHVEIVLRQCPSPVAVICSVDHTVVWLNPAAQVAGLTTGKPSMSGSCNETRGVALRSDEGDARQVVVFVPVEATRQGGARTRDYERALHNIARELAWVGIRPASPWFARFTDLPKFDALTEREREALRLLTAGKSVAAIANQLFVSPSTVRNYLSAIYAKFGVRGRAELLELVFEGQSDGSTD